MDDSQMGESELGSDFICHGSVDESISPAAMDWISEESGLNQETVKSVVVEEEEYVPGILESMGCRIDSDNEDESEQGQVKCLYTVAELEKTCLKQNLRLSAETNRYLLYLTVRKLGQSRVQKIVKKLVEAGHLAWEEEGYEVESILDYAKEEDGTEFYLIKWRYWSHAFNTWEPVRNLGCADLVEQFHRINGIGDTPPVGKLQSVTMQDDCESTKTSIDNLYQRILESAEPMTPLKLLQLHSPPKNEHSLIWRKTRMLSDNIAQRRKLRAKTTNISNKRSVAYRKMKTEATAALKQWERGMNALHKGAPLIVENEVDLDGPPESFQYINDYMEGPNVSIPTDPIVGCECTDCYEERKTCCGVMAGHDYAYYKGGKVRLPRGVPIYECNKRCACGPECQNRVVQHGRRHRVAIFKTKKAGWGVKALQKIKRGSFVMEYVGEVITHEEAECRGRIYDAECRTYLFDLDFNGDDSPFIVDAGFYGNESHFVNHSCDPNMAVYAVWINTLDPRLPRLALFAKRDISRGEELTFDYMMTGDTTAQADGEAAGLENSTVTPRKMQRPGFRLQDEDMLAVELPDDGEDGEDSDSQVADVQADLKPLDTELFSKPLSQDSLKALRVDTTSSTDVVSVPTPPPSESGTGDSSFDEPFKIPASKIVSPSPAMKYRIMCQCGAKNCRKYLF